MPGLAPYKSVLAVDERRAINLRGTTFFVRLATGEIRVTLRSQQVADGGGESYTLRMTEAEKWFHAQEFDEVILENTSGAQNTIEVYVGYGDFEKPVPDIVNVQVTLATTASAQTIADKINIDVGNVGAEQLLPANTNRVKAYITALSTNAEEIRVGDSNVSATRGTPLAPGESLIWEGGVAAFACSIATPDQRAAVTEFLK